MEIHGKRIRIYRNGDTYDHGLPLLVGPTNQRHFEQFLRDASRLTTTRVKYVYTTEGVRIRALEDLRDGMGVVVTAGEGFRKVDYQLPTSKKRFNAFSKSNLVLPILRDHPIRERRGEKGVELLEHVDLERKNSEIALFDASTKAFKIAIFENGEFRQPGQKLILNHRNCKSFDQLLKYLSTMKIIKSGQVRKLYDGRTTFRIKHLSQIYDGINMILSSSEPLQTGPYQFIDLLHQPRVMKGYDVYDKTIKICKFFVNGDPYHTGLTLSLTQRKNPTLKRLLSLLNTKIELVSGRIMKLYHISGTRITDIDQLSSGGKYVMVANDDIFIKCRYDMMVLRSTVLRPLNGQTFQTEMQRVRRAIDDAALKSENVKIGERREEKLSMRGKGFGFIVESATRITAVERAGKKIVKEVVDEEEEFVVQNVSDARVKSREASVPKPTSPKAVGKINSPEPKALASQESAPSKPIHTSNQTKLTNNTTPTHSQSKPTSPVLDHSFNKPTSPPRSHTPTDPISKTSPTKVFDGTKSKIETKIPSNPDIKPRNSIGTKARDSKAASSSSVKSQVPPILSRNSSQKAVVKAEEVEFEDEEFSGESSEVSDEESDEESGEESGEEVPRQRQKSEEYYPKPTTPKEFLSQTKSNKSISKIPVSRTGSMTRV